MKGSPLHPTCLQLLVPPQDGAIKYYGDRSGELATFINQTIPGTDVALGSFLVEKINRLGPGFFNVFNLTRGRDAAVKHKHSASDVDDEAEEFMEGSPVSAGPERVALTIRLPSILAREVRSGR